MAETAPIHTGLPTCSGCPWLGIQHEGCVHIDLQEFKAKALPYPQEEKNVKIVYEAGQ